MSGKYTIFKVLFLFLSKNVSANMCNLDVKVTQTLMNEGFHRNLTYNIVFTNEDQSNNWIKQDCIITLDQTLPPGVYVNPDQLGELRRANKLNAIPKNRINIEQISEQSEESSVYMIGLVSENKVYLWLLVHARYHEAVSGGGNVRNEISAPRVYLRCPDQEQLDLCGKAISPSVTFLCNDGSREKCSWKEIPFTMMTNTVVWDVPVGDLDHYYSVAFGTALAVMSGSMYLLKAVHEFKMRLKRK